jgi:hypothetical protein
MNGLPCSIALRIEQSKNSIGQYSYTSTYALWLLEHDRQPDLRTRHDRRVQRLEPELRVQMRAYGRGREEDGETERMRTLDAVLDEERADAASLVSGVDDQDVEH